MEGPAGRRGPTEDNRCDTDVVAKLGERVTVTARPMGAGCEVEVSSRPLVPLTLVDYGRNFINMQHMIAFLTERATEKSQIRETPQTEPGP